MNTSFIYKLFFFSTKLKNFHWIVIFSILIALMYPVVNSTPSENVYHSGVDNKDSVLESFRQFPLAQTEAFIQRRLFNTSVALTVPLFAFTLPQRAVEGTSVDLANQVIYFTRTSM